MRKNTIKRLLSFTLTTAMLVTMICLPAHADETFDEWTIRHNSGCQGTAELDTAVKYSGASSLKVVNTNGKGDDQYLYIYARVPVVEGKRYTVSAKLKAENITQGLFLVGWDKRRSITPLANTYDWTNFEFEYLAASTSEVDVALTLEGYGTLWIDDFCVIDVETGENLILHPSFEVDKADVEEEVSEDTTPESNSYIDTMTKIRSSESFTLDEYMSVISDMKYLPLYKKDGLTIDGDDSDWDGVTELVVPMSSNQYVLYDREPEIKEFSSVGKFCYDDKNLYMYVEVTDDNHFYVAGDNYWTGDSIQFSLSEITENFGSEIGLAYNPETGEGEVYGSGLSVENRNRIKIACQRVDDKTIYEVKVPFDVKYLGTPDYFYFNYIVNDNDGEGRKRCIRMAQGIAEGKTTKYSPVSETMEDDKQWFAWVEGPTDVLVGESATYEYYIVNTGDDATFTVTNSYDGSTANISVPAKSGVRRKVEYTFDTHGQFEFPFTFVGGSQSYSVKKVLNVNRPDVDASYAKKYLETLTKQEKEIKNLLAKCEKKGIETPYELADYKVIERFVTYVGEDIANNDLARIYYTEECTTEIYNQIKADLQAYLNGTKKPLVVPQFEMSDITFDEQTAYADMRVGNTTENRPAFFVGWGHFNHATADIANFSDFGFNTVQFGIQPGHMADSGLWRAEGAGSPKGTIDSISTEKHSGEMSLYIHNETAKTPNVFFQALQSATVEPGKNYVLKGWAKADNAAELKIGPVAYGDPTVNLSGTYDWKEFSLTWTAPAGVTSTSVQILCTDKTDAAYIDDVVFCEEGSDVNLLGDGGFEMVGGWIFNYDNPNLVATLKNLDEAEANNQAVSFIITPTNFPQMIIQKYGIQMEGGGFLTFNPNAPIAREVMEDFLRRLIPLVKDYTCVDNFCLSNEPEFEARGCGDFYLEDWRQWLQERYGTIEVLNSEWGSSYTAFSEIDLSASATYQGKNWDYKVYNDELFAEWHKWMYDIIKEEAPDIPCHSKIMGYMWTDASRHHLLDNGTGYQGFDDFYEVSGCDTWNYYAEDKDTPLGKSMWYEYLTSLKNVPVINSEDHIIGDGDTEVYDIIADNYMATDIWQGAIHGRYMSDIWVWQREPGYEGHALYRPAMISKISRTTSDLNRNSYYIEALQKDPRDVGILFAEPSALFDAATMAATYQTYEGLLENGKRVQFIVESQLEKINTCKLVIVPNMTYATSEMVEALKNYIAAGGKALILSRDSLKKDEHHNPNDQATLDYIFANSKVVDYTGNSNNMTSPTAEEWSDILATTLKENFLSYVTIVDAATGERVKDIEYNVAWYDGGVAISIVSYQGDKTINVKIGNTIVEKAVELRSETEVGKDIAIKVYEPILLKIDNANAFVDTYGHWAEENIVNLTGEKIIYGVSDTRFAPQANITRAEFLALLVRAEKYAGVAYEGNVPDVKAEDWFAGTVAAAVNAGVIEAGTNFRPNDKITREEMCGLLITCYELKNGEAAGGTLNFTDNAGISDPDTVAKAVALELMYGNADGSFAPKALSTRAEAAAVVERYIK